MDDKMEFKNEISTTTSEQTTTPSSSSSSSSTPRTFHIYFEDWMGRGAHITDTDKTTQLYHVESHMRRPNVVFHRSPSSPSATTPLATAKFHSLSPNISVTLSGRDITLKPKSKWKQTDYEFASPTLGATLTWTGQTPWVVTESVCLDDRGVALARFLPVTVAKRKAGRIEFAEEGGRALSQDEVDEIVVTGVTMLNYRCTASTMLAASVA